MEALEAGRQVEQQHVERPPGDIAQELTQGRGLERATPHEALGLRSAEREGRAVLEQQVHGHALHPINSDGGLDGAVGSGEWGVVHSQQARHGRAVQVSVQHPHGPAGARQGSGEVGGHEALAHPPLAAHHRDQPADAGEPLGHAAPLGGDLLGEPGAVGAGELVVGAEVQGHAPARCARSRRVATKRCRAAGARVAA